MCAQSLSQSCPNLCYPMVYSPPGSCVHGILQARILEWIAMPCSRGSSQSKDQTHVSLVQPLSRVRHFVTPWTAAHQASPSITNSQSLLKLMSIELVMSFNHLTLCHPLLLLPSVFPSIKVFSNESVLCISGQSIRASAPVSVLPKNIQDWFPLRSTGLISLQSKCLLCLLNWQADSLTLAPPGKPHLWLKCLKTMVRRATGLGSSQSHSP